MRTFTARAVFVAVAFVACGGSSVPDSGLGQESAFDAGTVAPDAAGAVGMTDARADGAPNTDLGTCAATFGNALTASFGRLDGTLVALVRPQDQQCAMPNGDHLTVQVQVAGAVYRMVVNVQADRGSDVRIRLGRRSAPLPAPPFAEGWHTGLALDYVALGASSKAGFEPLAMDAAVEQVVGELHIGAPISVYATSGKGRPESAHLVHRNDGQVDGAIVVDPTSAAPTFLLFHFENQVF